MSQVYSFYPYLHITRKSVRVVGDIVQKFGQDKEINTIIKGLRGAVFVKVKKVNKVSPDLKKSLNPKRQMKKGSDGNWILRNSTFVIYSEVTTW